MAIIESVEDTVANFTNVDADAAIKMMRPV